MLLRRLGRRGGGRGGLTPYDGAPRLGGGIGASGGAEVLSVVGIKSGSAVTRRMALLSVACCWFWVTDGSALPAPFPPSPPASLLSASLSANKEIHFGFYIKPKYHSNLDTVKIYGVVVLSSNSVFIYLPPGQNPSLSHTPIFLHQHWIEKFVLPFIITLSFIKRDV